MEYIDGLDLEKVLTCLRKNNQKMPDDIALFIIKQICQGLEYAHNKKDEEGKSLKIVHRDISTQNIIISTSGNVKITDFGISKAAIKTRKTAYGTMKGKLLYMSPEQANGEEIDKRSDIFSIGTLLYEMITGENPFDADVDVRIIDNVRGVNINYPEYISPELLRTLKKALVKNPKARYQDCTELLADIEAYLSQKTDIPNNKRLAKFIKPLMLATKAEKKSKEEKAGSNKRIILNRRKVNAETLIVQRPPEALGSNITKEKRASNIIYKFLSISIGVILILSIVLVLKSYIFTDHKNILEIPEQANVTHEKKVLDNKREEPEIKKTVPPKPKYGRLDVFAKPWAYVTVSDVVNNVTSPFRSSQVKPGAYAVTVFYEPDNKIVYGNAVVKAGKRTLCTVDFLVKKPVLGCR